MPFLSLIAGLGNPGKEYSDTRHNIGFKVAEALVKDYGGSWQRDGDAEIAEVTLPGSDMNRVRVVKPQSYMNNSGQPVSRIARFYKIPLDEILVVHDELDLPFGTIRLKAGGGDAGNNGLRSITACMSGGDYMRLRFGIGKPPDARIEGSSWVLGKFTTGEREALPELVGLSLEAIRALAEHGLKFAQNKFNG